MEYSGKENFPASRGPMGHPTFGEKAIEYLAGRAQEDHGFGIPMAA